MNSPAARTSAPFKSTMGATTRPTKGFSTVRNSLTTIWCNVTACSHILIFYRIRRLQNMWSDCKSNTPANVYWFYPPLHTTVTPGSSQKGNKEFSFHIFWGIVRFVNLTETDNIDTTVHVMRPKLPRIECWVKPFAAHLIEMSSSLFLECPSNRCSWKEMFVSVTHKSLQCTLDLFGKRGRDLSSTSHPFSTALHSASFQQYRHKVGQLRTLIHLQNSSNLLWQLGEHIYPWNIRNRPHKSRMDHSCISDPFS